MGILERQRGDGDISAQVKVSPGAGAGGGVDIIDLSASGCDPAEPRLVCVSFAIQRLTSPNVKQTRPVQALIVWGGKRSAAIPVLIDVVRGRRLCVEASHALSIKIFYGTQNDTGPEYEVSCSCVYGGPPTVNTCTQSPIALTAGSTSGMQPLPAYASELAIFASASHATPAAEVQIFRDNDPLSEGPVATWQAGETPVLLPGYAVNYRIKNIGGVDASFTPVARLAI